MDIIEIRWFIEFSPLDNAGAYLRLYEPADVNAARLQISTC